MDAVAHDGTVHMGFGGAQVVLDGPVILLRSRSARFTIFALFPAQGVPATRREQGGVRTKLP